MKKKHLYVIITIIIVGVIGALLWRQGVFGGDQALLHSIKDKPALVELFNKAAAAEAEIKKDPTKAEQYFNAGLFWKSLAEQGGPEVFFSRSLQVYEQGIKLFGQKNILFYLDAGNLAEHVNDFAKAETYYKKAIEISSGDESGYLNLAHLYFYKLKRPKADILAVYAEGAKRLVNPVIIISDRASYLRQIGDYAAALKDYTTLSLNFPANQGYKDIIAELKAKIKASAINP